VPELLARRQTIPPPPQRRPWRSSLLTFTLGLSLGYGLSSPAIRQVPSLLAGLIHAPRSIAALVNPMASGNRRVLVLGRDKVGDNTDVMFTVQVKDGITLVTQVPRDTYVETDQLGTIKANALFALGGVDAAKGEVAKLIGAPVQRYFKLNLDAVAKVADALGGVEVDVPKHMFYVDNAQGLYIDLAPGRQVLRGEALEGFLRFRHDELGDLGRMERQRLVMSKVFSKLAQPATITRLPALLKIAGDDVLTDLSPIEMTQLLTAMAQTRLSSQRLPGRLYWQDDLSYWMPDTNTQHPTGSGDEPTN
jgi:LCP family protein required for cell wall assembly